ncbi:MAG: phosphorylase [Bacteroidetes bacterium]|nr:MAG: phosphorylase [Bacteroidota bacterium]
MPIEPSELILRDDGSIYHLNLKPEQVADKIIVVGDPNRVALVSSRFDTIEYKVSGREFNTHTGIYNGTRLSVISTGIGVDNIDIVINELDAVVNIDLKTRLIKPEKKHLEIVRLGTSGSLQKDIPTGSFIVSEYAIGMDGVLNFYKTAFEKDEEDLINAFHDQIDYPEILPKPYIVRASKSLFEKLEPGNYSGITATASGFYGPQGRKLRLQTAFEKQNEELGKFNFNGKRITNFEMETSSLYGLSSLLGHESCTVCAIIANRYRKEFCEKPTEVISDLIDLVLERLTT